MSNTTENSNNKLILRAAVIEDLELLLYWDKKQHVIDCDPDDSWNWEFELSRNPTWREQMIAEVNEEQIGFIQIIDPYHEETHYWGNVGKNKRAIDIWIGEEKNLKRGFGTMMMRSAIQRCFKDKEVNGILVDPLKTNIKAHRFYKKLGFELIEERMLGDSNCLVFELRTKER